MLAALGPDADLGHVMWHLDQGPAHVRELAADVVGPQLAAATDIDPLSVETDRPHIATWVWLTRTWPPGGPWGMPRGVARGLPDPAVDLLTEWALRAAKTELDRVRGALNRGALMRITAGQHDGQLAVVLASAWRFDDEKKTVVDGPPPGYEVQLLGPESESERRVVVPTEMMRLARREEMAEAAGFPTTFSDDWHGCVCWAQGLILWHQHHAPEVWAREPAQAYAPAIERLLTVALLDAVRQEGLSEPDGSRVHLAKFSAALEIVGRPHRWERLTATVERLAEAGIIPARALLERIQLAPEKDAADERRAMLELAAAVLTANGLAARVVPPGSTPEQPLAAGTVSPMLADQALAIQKTAAASSIDDGTVSVLVDGTVWFANDSEMTWSKVSLACAECQARTGLTLIASSDPEGAYECGSGHRRRDHRLPASAIRHIYSLRGAHIREDLEIRRS
ncbi:hypothetical protein ACFY12_34905 [Streptomyces sp. NPDC001339]|uniref:hypothetical protein n=1 Tax=Streptomyces sp. NPDC001339 TaxID=3364563 RepID=UPI0036CB3BC6